MERPVSYSDAIPTDVLYTSWAATRTQLMSERASEREREMRGRRFKKKKKMRKKKKQTKRTRNGMNPETE